MRSICLSAAALALACGPALAQTAAAPATPATAAAPAAPATAAPAAPPAAVPPSPNIVPTGDILTTLQNSGRFTILVKALNATNLASVVKSTPDLTLFAPTDQAFEQLTPAALAQLLAPANAANLQRLLVYHLVHLNLDSAKFKGAKGPVQTVGNTPLEVDGSGAVIKVNNADIIQPDVHATNGTIQVIDRVLVPPGMQLPTTAQAAPVAPPAG
ncbi:MAG TPA: fasciclin domain-containing protein [Caulobacteraceae bacterium]|nr:fasciclin domain-containing protein [Caulobacteraceae bacterium]